MSTWVEYKGFIISDEYSYKGNFRIYGFNFVVPAGDMESVNEAKWHIDNYLTGEV